MSPILKGRPVRPPFLAAYTNRWMRLSADCRICRAAMANSERGGNMIGWCENGNVSVVSSGSHGGLYA